MFDIELFKKLPREIHEKILQLYWKSYFLEKVIEPLQEYKYIFNKNVDFLKKHIVGFGNRHYHKQVLCYIVKCEDFFVKISRSRGMFLFLKPSCQQYTELDYIIYNTYSIANQDIINTGLEMTCKFCIFTSPPILRNHMYELFMDFSRWIQKLETIDS